MPLLILAFEISALFFIMRWVKNGLDLSMESLAVTIQSKNDLFQALEDRLGYTQEANQVLESCVDTESALYEVTKELSRSIEEADIVNTFKEKLCALFNLSECSFSDTQFSGISREYDIYTITYGSGKTKYFITKDSAKIDKAKMSVLVNQLELSLKRFELYREIQELAITDSLTGIFVRRYFLERFKQEFLRSKQNHFALSFLMVDADNFKSYNYTYGHIVGDTVLKEIAKIIKYSLRQIDMCARYGGEEFCILLPETDKEGARLVAERLRQSVGDAQLKIFNENLKMTISIGLSTFPEDAETLKALIDKADKALYQAKALGKNKVCAWGK